MSNKLILQDLANALAAQSKQSKKINETFVRAFFETIEESLEKERFVKIKGWGTFKLIAIGERESININTGERFQIGGHYKISFVPETKLKETINKPFSHFQTITLNDKVTVADLEAADEEEYPVLTEENIEQPIEPTSTDLQNSQKTENTTLNLSTQENVKTDPTLISEEYSNAQFASDVHGNSTNKPLEDNRQANFENDADNIATESEKIQCTIADEPLGERSQANIDDPTGNVTTPNESNTDDTCHTTESPSQVADEIPSDNNTFKESSTKGPIEIKITEFPAISFVRPWYKILIGICIVVALCLGYLIGFFRLVGPKHTTKIKTERIVVRDTALASSRKANSTATIVPQETSQQLDTTIIHKEENKKVKKAKNTSDMSSGNQIKSQSTVITYKVKKGESLHDISRKFYHSDKYVNMIIKYNHITNPDRIVYDTVLQIPPLK